MGNMFDMSLLEYAEVGDMAGVKAHVAKGGDVNKRDFYKNTALHRAACMGYADIASFLVEHGADVNAQAKDGWTPLHLASRWGRIDVLRVLVNANADKHMTTDDGRTAGELLKVGLNSAQTKEAIALLDYRPHAERKLSAAAESEGNGGGLSFISCMSL
ncbi:ankyrin repeat-containing domain protein [Tribonema minus]|uniref:Ankyrin repeat-containing domain protein n=1 Tax=Tribonema minus TaxID=303371 RepID=A0A835YZ15_9STRA|nr:ankyrin repeat-containing domain protein [Tribonema minus]